jgi:hypothetical protein
MKILGRECVFFYSRARPKTCWWSNDWRPERVLSLRTDKLVSLSRVYCRDMRTYGYSLIIGRLKLGVTISPREKST